MSIKSRIFVSFSRAVLLKLPVNKHAVVAPEAFFFIQQAKHIRITFTPGSAALVSSLADSAWMMGHGGSRAYQAHLSVPRVDVYPNSQPGSTASSACRIQSLE
jgi:hypothetical protein